MKFNSISNTPSGLVLKAPESTLVKTANYVNFRTDLGEFKVNVYKDQNTNQEHMAFIKGDVVNKEGVLTRVHSKCETSEIFHNQNCECKQQLHEGLQRVLQEEGALVYLDQEGRGIGMGAKLQAYELQDHGFDSAEANLALGFEVDERSYDVAAEIINDLRIKSVRLLTNNQDKTQQLRASGITVVEQLEHVVTEPRFAPYYAMKNEALGHSINLEKHFQGGDHTPSSTSASLQNQQAVELQMVQEAKVEEPREIIIGMEALCGE